MSNIENQTISQIVKIKDYFLKPKLSIPDFQRPYKWTTKNVNQLIDDLLLFKNHETYRIGTIVLYNNEENSNLEIVDGQQRTITLSFDMVEVPLFKSI